MQAEVQKTGAGGVGGGVVCVKMVCLVVTELSSSSEISFSPNIWE